MRVEHKAANSPLAGNSRTDESSTTDVTTWRSRPIRMLRLAQVRAMTGLGKTKIYELQAEGDFPMRIKLTEHSVAGIEDEVQAWLTQRVKSSAPLPTLQRKSGA